MIRSPLQCGNRKAHSWLVAKQIREVEVERMGVIKTLLWRFGTFIRFSHTIFALPFALIAMLVAGNGRVALGTVGWIVWCLMSGRTAAMCFNRLADWEIDKQNPRTSTRHTLVRKSHAWLAFLIAIAALLFGTWRLNTLCFALSPLMIASITFYSLTKRFTSLCHLFLGLALGIAPLGAWAAVRGNLWDAQPFVLAAGVLCWVFGFDLIYALLDIDFDRRQGLHSFPAGHGVDASLRLARILHIVAALAFFYFGWLAELGAFYWVAWVMVLAELLVEHRLANPEEPASINTAFFNANAVVSVSLFAGVFLHYLTL
jgi:4-hydroxybenzoate polyprenyltransferase